MGDEWYSAERRGQRIEREWVEYVSKIVKPDVCQTTEVYGKDQWPDSSIWCGIEKDGTKHYVWAHKEYAVKVGYVIPTAKDIAFTKLGAQK